MSPYFSHEKLLDLEDRLEFVHYTIQMHEEDQMNHRWDFPPSELKQMRWEGIEALKSERNKLLVEVEALTFYLSVRRT